MPSIETQLSDALQELKRELTAPQLDKVLSVIKLCILADGRRHMQPVKPDVQTPPPAETVHV